MTYTATGPFTNGAAPGITAQFLNGVEAYLALVNSAGVDASVTSDGAGNETLTSVTANRLQLTGAGAILSFLAGSISRVSFFNGTGNATVSHGLGAAPSLCLIMYAAGATPFGSVPTHPIYYYNATTTQVTVVADSGYSWLGMALHT